MNKKNINRRKISVNAKCNAVENDLQVGKKGC